MSKTTIPLSFLAALALGLPTACGGGESSASSGAGQQISQAARQEARQTYDTLCVTCHGPNGTGDGPGATALDPKPRNYTDAEWQASVTDEEIKKTITLGGAAVGKSPVMPAQPQLKSKPEVLEALVDIIRGFAE